MNRYTIVAIFVPFLLPFFVFLIQKQSNNKIVILGEKTFTVEIADTPASHERGLSGHKPLLDNQGMFFIFDQPGINRFWMKDMLFSIDIIWISADMRVVGFEKSLSPLTYPQSFGPDLSSQYVLEVSAGQIEKLNIKIGDKVNFIKNNR